MIKVSGLTVGSTITVASDSETITKRLTQGVLFPLTGTTNELITVSDARYVAGAYAVAGLVAGGMITRRRVSKRPMLGFIF